ncbi:hypothetical protein H4W32_002466 [Actinophytocola algeriensis]|uniref:Uncharacterized protein n=1 Tax=Actinophytocola algeriensis TaxID=1768010 RepID=A0A7W7Q977_9PSEU|nr:hypothetical protein [Actinophytocola algeriensis]MBE1474424.1 hypothetical protein [Actinophytocola algeriensis]
MRSTILPAPACWRRSRAMTGTMNATRRTTSVTVASSPSPTEDHTP